MLNETAVTLFLITVQQQTTIHYYRRKRGASRRGPAAAAAAVVRLRGSPGARCPAGVGFRRADGRPANGRRPGRRIGFPHENWGENSEPLTSRRRTSRRVCWQHCSGEPARARARARLEGCKGDSGARRSVVFPRWTPPPMRFDDNFPVSADRTDDHRREVTPTTTTTTTTIARPPRSARSETVRTAWPPVPERAYFRRGARVHGTIMLCRRRDPIS